MKIQYRFLGILLALGLIASVAIFFVHRYQVQRSAVLLLTSAREAVAAGQPADAVRLYGNYLAVQPTAEAHYELGKLLASLGDPAQAFFQLEAALRLRPEMAEAREELVTKALALERYSDARSHLENYLLKSEPQKRELRFYLATALRGQGEYAESKTLLAELWKEFPTDVEIAGAYSNLLTEHFDDFVTAREVVDALVAQASENADAWFTRAQFLLSQSKEYNAASQSIAADRLAVAAQDAAQGLTIKPESIPLRWLALEVALAAGNEDQAESLANEGITLAPREPRFYGGLAQVHLLRGDAPGAVEALTRGLTMVPGNGDLLWNLAQLQMDRGETQSVESLLKQLQSVGFPIAGVRYLQAKLAYGAGSYSEAAKILEESRAAFDRSQELLRQADFLLGLCYAQTGRVDQQLTSLRRVVNASPLWIPGREALAVGLMRAGRFAEAANEFEQMVSMPEPPVSVVLSYARLLLLQGLGPQTGTSDWSRLEAILNMLAEFPEAQEEVAILRAELLVAQAERAQAIKLLEDYVVAAPQSPRVWEALVELLARGVETEDTQQVANTLERAQAQVGDTVGLRLAAARQVLRSETPDVEQLKKLDSLNTDWNDEEQFRFCASMASLYRQAGDLELAHSLALRARQTKQGAADLSLHLQLFELALQSQDDEAMQNALTQVKQIEGEGPLWRVGRAIREIVLAEKAEAESAQAKQHYEVAIQQLSEAAVERPQWSAIPRLLGQIHDQRQQRDLAISKFREAISLGEQNPQLVARAIFLLFEQGRFVEADEIIRRLQQQRNPFSSGVARIAAQVSLQLENFDRALTLAQRAAEDSGTQEDLIWLAQVYDIAGDKEKALAEFNAAIEVEPTAPGPWIALVQMLARAGNASQAREYLVRAAEAIDPAVVHDALAQGYEALRDDQLAQQNYEKAFATAGQNLELKRRYVEFSIRTLAFTRAKEILEQLLTEQQSLPAEYLPWARRTLGTLLATQVDQPDLLRAEKLLNENLTAPIRDPQDERVLALVLSRKASPADQQQAVSLLERLTRAQNRFSMPDQRLLADLYKRTDQSAQYSRTMRAILGNGGSDDPEIVRSYAETLISRGETAEGQLWLDRLKRLDPDSLSTSTIDAELLFQAGEILKVLDLIAEKSNLSGGKAWAAATAERFFVRSRRKEQTAAAEQFAQLADQNYQALMTAGEDEPHRYVLFLARQGRISDALELLPEREPAVLLDLATHTLNGGNASEVELKQLIEALQQGYEAAPQLVNLLIMIADVLAWQGDIDGAIAQYEKALAQDARSIPALNNLATLLGFTKREIPKAVSAINEAIRVMGPHDILLDTRGTVLLSAGNAAAAEADFRAAIETNPLPDRLFHLAQALRAQGKMAEARTAMAQARQKGLSADGLHPLERPVFTNLAAEL